MTTIAFDGKTLAADRRATQGNLIRSTRKIMRVNGCLLGAAGEQSFAQALFAWWSNGAKPSEWPAHAADKDDWVGLMVVRPNRIIERYERTPHPLPVLDKTFAIGSGRDFALAAMYLGCDAARAVRIASKFDMASGNGVDTLTL